MSGETNIDTSPASPSRRRRSLLPRFRLPAAFVFAILFCFFFAWVRSNYVRMCEEEAAVEALLQVDAGIEFQWSPDLRIPVAEEPDLRDRSFLKRLSRTLNLTPPPRIARVILRSDDPNDPKLLPALAGLRMFPDLWRVELHGSGFDDRTMAELAKIDSLTSLQLDRTRITGNGVALLAEHESFRSISIWDDPTGDLLCGVLSLTNLTLISLSGSPIEKEDVETLASFPHLLQLFLADMRFSGKPDILLPLERAESLLELSIQADKADEGAVVELPTLPKLEKLHARGVAFADLPSYPNLEEFDAEGVTDEMLAKWETPQGLWAVQLYPPVTRERARDLAAKIVSSRGSVTYYPADGKAVTYDAN